MAAPFTIIDALILCGVDDNAFWNGAHQAERISTDIFDDDYNSILDKTFEEMDEDLKSYSILTVANGQIRLNPGTKRNIRGFMQWVKDQLRIGLDPTDTQFPIRDTAMLIRQHKSHKVFCAKSKATMETAKPARFTEKIKWEEWEPTLSNFLRSIPGRNGIPLSYVIRPLETPTIIPDADFLDEYINRAPLTGSAYRQDASEVHTYITHFIAGNTIAEAKVMADTAAKNGRIDYINLKSHYEGVGINAIDIIAADKVIETLFYSGEKKPHMWWNEFEKQLTKAFTIYDRKERREVYSDEMRLRTLTRKVNADFLQSTKSALMIELNKTPMTMTYTQALSNFRQEVNIKFPPDLSSGPNRTRRIHEVGVRPGRGHERRNPYSGRGYQGRNNGRGGRQHNLYGRDRYGRATNRNGRDTSRSGSVRPRPGTRHITLNDGTPMDVHPAVQYSPEIWFNMSDVDRQLMISDRENHKRRRQASSLNSDTNSLISNISNNTNQTTTNNSNQTSSSIMGGRNEQEQQRTRFQENRN